MRFSFRRGATPNAEGGPPRDVQFRPPQPITLTAEVPGSDEEPFSSVILSCAEGVELTISMPAQKDEEIPLLPGTKAVFHIAQFDGVRTFSTHVLRRQGGIHPVLVLAWPSVIERVNRRDTIRIPAEVVADVTYCPEDGEVPRVLRSITTDLSEGGMRLVVPGLIPVGSTLSVRLHLPGEEINVCGGRVVRAGSSKLPGGDERAWVGVQFQNVSGALQRNLRQFLWQLQRELLRRGIP